MQLQSKVFNALVLAFAGVCFGIIPARGDPAIVPAEIHTFQQFYALTPQQAQKGVPVRVMGVVLCFDPGWNQLYVHDGAQTMWLSPTLFQTNLQARIKVELTGSTTVGQGGVSFTNLHLQVLGQGELPVAKSLEVSQLGRDFGQWIEIKGQIRVAETS